MYSLRVVGYQLLVPFGENTRYDLVIDDGVRLARVQCKTGRLRNGVIVFRTVSTYGHHPNPKILKRDYLGEIDFFGVYCPETAGVYLVPISDIPNRAMAYLRIDPPLNAQRKRIRFAADYELACRRPTPEPGVRAGGSGSSA
jgi:hypothetical protein